MVINLWQYYKQKPKSAYLSKVIISEIKENWSTHYVLLAYNLIKAEIQHASDKNISFTHTSTNMMNTHTHNTYHIGLICMYINFTINKSKKDLLFTYQAFINSIYGICRYTYKQYM